MYKNSKLEEYIGSNKETITLFLSIFAIVISVISLKYGCDNTKYVKKQFEISQLPNWYLERSYSSNNVDLISVQMKSHLPEVLVKKMTVFPPSDLHKNDSIEIIGDKWNTHAFLTNLNKTISSYYDVPESNPYANSSWVTRYPFAVKIEYWQNNQTKSSICLFLLHLRIFNKERVKVFNIEPVEFFEPSEAKEIVKRVDLLNKNAGILADFLSINSVPAIYYEVGNILSISKQVEGHEINVLDKYLKFDRIDTAYYPKFTIDLTKGDSVIRALGVLMDNLNIFPKKIQTAITKASSFIDTHPLLKESEDVNAYIINSSWKSQQTYYEWIKIVWELQKFLCAELSDKYNTDCDTTAVNQGYNKYLESLNIPLRK